MLRAVTQANITNIVMIISQRLRWQSLQGFLLFEFLLLDCVALASITYKRRLLDNFGTRE
jgi:hypothetical protein